MGRRGKEKDPARTLEGAKDRPLVALVRAQVEEPDSKKPTHHEVGFFISLFHSINNFHSFNS
jgi:hypothetical protein